MEIIRWAKSKGWRVTAEVTPHHLLLTDDLAEDYDPVFKVNPPLRTRADVDALRQALADGTIDCVATDHAPHPVEAKETEWAAAANGMTGLETALRVVQRGHGRHRPARLGGRRGPDVRPPGGHRPRAAATASRWPRAPPPT